MQSKFLIQLWWQKSCVIHTLRAVVSTNLNRKQKESQAKEKKSYFLLLVNDLNWMDKISMLISQCLLCNVLSWLVILDMSELLFEGYRCPSILYGIDALFSHYYNRPAAGLYLFEDLCCEFKFYCNEIVSRSNIPHFSQYINQEQEQRLFGGGVSPHYFDKNCTLHKLCLILR